MILIVNGCFLSREDEYRCLRLTSEIKWLNKEIARVTELCKRKSSKQSYLRTLIHQKTEREHNLTWFLNEIKNT